MPKKKSFVYFLLKISVLPVALILLLMIFLNNFMTLRTMHENARIKAYQIAHMLSVPIGNDGVDIMAAQSAVLGEISRNTIKVNYLQVNQSALPVKSQTGESFLDILQATKVTKFVPVTSKNELGNDKLIGYLYATIDITHMKKQVLSSLLLELLLSGFLFVVFFILLFTVASGKLSGFSNLVKISHKVANRSLEDVQFLEHERSFTKEMRLFEDALHTLSAKLLLAKEQLKEVVDDNHELKLSMQSGTFQQHIFQAMITHELKTPLNAISGGLQLIETQDLNQTNADSFLLIRKGYKKLNNMLDRIIELNNLQQGKIEVNKSLFGPDELFKSLAEKYHQTCTEKGLSITIDIKHTQTKLSGDKEKIFSILNHILDNAVKFTYSGTISLVSNIQHISNSELVLWTADVIDTGIGINPSLQEDIFSAYVQLDTGANREFEGSGLGLTLAKKLTELMFGRLSVSSKEGEGSRFRLALELAHGDMATASAGALNNMRIMHLHSGKSVDFIKLLTQQGAKVQGFSDHNLALAAASKTQYDAVTICEHIKPDLAFAFATSLRKQEGLKHRSILVYFVSEHALLGELDVQASGIDYTHVYENLADFSKQLNLWIDWNL